MTLDDLIDRLNAIKAEHGGQIDVLHENQYDSDYGYPDGERYSEPYIDTYLFDPKNGQVFPVLPSARVHVIFS